MEETKKQSVSGFKVVNYSVKKSKEDEKLKLVLEASVDDIGSGESNLGAILKGLLQHMTGETEVSLNIFIDKQ